VTGDKERLESILPLVKKYGAAVVGLTIDEEGVPKTAEKRVDIAMRILAACEAIGIPKEDLVIDALVLTASAEQEQAHETLKAVSMIKRELGLATSLGVSNISFGLPDRAVINAAYLTMALGHGLDAAMVNPYDPKMGDDIRRNLWARQTAEEHSTHGESRLWCTGQGGSAAEAAALP
jgi:5-methyltetrahydrofolate--homocysteine methyltransferase